MNDKQFKAFYDRFWWLCLWAFVIACNTCEMADKVT